MVEGGSGSVLYVTRPDYGLRLQFYLNHEGRFTLQSAIRKYVNNGIGGF